MKRYKVERFQINKLKSFYLTELSKSGKRDGVRTLLFFDGKRGAKTKYKNDLLNGIRKIWWHNSKSWFFINWKKDKIQGIKIVFQS